MASEILVPTPTRSADTLSRPAFPMPAGACDSHVHVFGPVDRYPHVAQPHYTLPDGPPPLLDRMTRGLGLDRFAIVQPSFYGTDNRCMLDALDELGDRARGVAMVDDGVEDEVLDAMHRRGVRALRLDLFLRAQWPIARIVDYIQRSAERIRPWGWHLQFYTPGYVVRDLVPAMPDIASDFVIDHMGYMLESDGLTRADFDRLIAAVASGRGWMKLSGPYRIAKDGNYARLLPYAQAIADALPDRTIWGSDWPHIPNGQMDTGALLNLLGEWVPDADRRKRILSDNPARLYDFQP
ncbi:putative TIM-barrel fold metal-dependent hydrolase [Acidovorax soli]|uniref:Putative TIM-barrel fold metal-dependent hydrolase n=1 Tax=Acidovorax soli TaxID=592050 RepID=A0A7X0PDV5_9BURK|nr:amidohydrolase family protein [Acidovorax soli]MBB6559762.1 putative TIM-barrel fold metal-dependent hydrolase [Acidovorax soli]